MKKFKGMCISIPTNSRNIHIGRVYLLEDTDGKYYFVDGVYVLKKRFIIKRFKDYYEACV